MTSKEKETAEIVDRIKGMSAWLYTSEDRRTCKVRNVEVRKRQRHRVESKEDEGREKRKL